MRVGSFRRVTLLKKLERMYPPKDAPGKVPIKNFK